MAQRDSSKTYSPTGVTLCCYGEGQREELLYFQHVCQNKWRTSLALSAAIISFPFAGAAVPQPITVNICTFLFPICSLSFTPSRSLSFSLFYSLHPQHLLCSYKSDNPTVNHSTKIAFFSVYKERDPFAVLLPWHNVK